MIRINPTGSSGYGQDFVDEIAGDWGESTGLDLESRVCKHPPTANVSCTGGSALEDLEMGLDHVLREFAYLEPTKVVAIGASYGGYMVNWIQGKKFGNRFRALVRSAETY